MTYTQSAQDFLTYLERTECISPESATRARSAERQTGQAVDNIIRELGFLPELVIANELAKFLSLESTLHLATDSDFSLLETLGYEFAADNAIVPFVKKDGSPWLVLANPFDKQTIAAVQYFYELPFTILVAPRSVIEDYIRDATKDVDTIGGLVDIEPASNVDLERLEDSARDAPVVKFVTRIIQKAVDENATDIHIEPAVDMMEVRFRRDGLLNKIENAPLSLHPGVISRLKILARLNIAERRLPQDGRLRLAVRGRDVDFRLSVIPSIHGETVVLRVLNREAVQLNLGSLGFDDAAIAKIQKLIQRPNGMILVTGPTGSGKTTTLYSILAEINRPELKIFTVEDPVEYRMAGVTQLQIDPAIGLTFASALRSVLRQDPDIILVGEIRDKETAEIAVQAALTGHLVLSTLHTNSAIASFSRLRDMGIEPFLIDATMRGVIGQRLLRQRCPNCAQHIETSRCSNCSGSGFKGRRTTFEILEMSETIRKAMMAGASEEAMELLAIEDGMHPMRNHAFKLVSEGVTTMAEAIRVVEMGGH
jgi:general secretion pathway protein E